MEVAARSCAGRTRVLRTTIKAREANRPRSCWSRGVGQSIGIGGARKSASGPTTTARKATIGPSYFVKVDCSASNRAGSNAKTQHGIYTYERGGARRCERSSPIPGVPLQGAGAYPIPGLSLQSASHDDAPISEVSATLVLRSLH